MILTYLTGAYVRILEKKVRLKVQQRVNSTKEITTLNSISLFGLIIRKLSLFLASTISAFLIGEQLAIRDLAIYLAIWVWAVCTSKVHTGIASSVLGFVILGSFGYSLFLG